jgi:hypothetical protein
MKKLISGILFSALAIAFLSSCEPSDCLCKYYDENDQLLGYDSWDGSDMSASDCANMESDNTVEVNGDEVVASNVSCSTSW